MNISVETGQIAALARAFDHVVGRLEQLVSTQKQLLRDVSHELRSPLARLQAALGLARQRAGVSADAELDRIEGEAERLNELIGQLLSLARLESGNERPEPEQIDLTALLENIVEDAAFEARAKRRNVGLSRTVPVTLTADPRLLHQALENIVRNAIEHTLAGTTVEVSMERDADPGWLLIAVRDHGPGCRRTCCRACSSRSSALTMRETVRAAATASASPSPNTLFGFRAAGSRLETSRVAV